MPITGKRLKEKECVFSGFLIIIANFLHKIGLSNKKKRNLTLPLLLRQNFR